MTPHSQTLAGLNVIDLSRYLPGPLVTRALRDYGANVVKIESPGGGDPLRSLFPDGALFETLNAGKQSIVLDLRKPVGCDVFCRLCRTADVVVESFRPGVMDNLGIGYQALSALNRRLIFLAISGYGQNSPLATRAGHDINYMATAGVLSQMAGPGGLPTVPRHQLADIMGGAMQATTRLLLALLDREKTGCGQFLDVSITEGLRLLSISADMLPVERHDLLSGGFACYNVYRAANGWVAVGALEPKFWRNLCAELGVPAFVDLQFDRERQKDICATLGEILSTKTAKEWEVLLGDRDCCVSEVQSLGGGRDSKAAAERSPKAISPRLGEHSVAVLRHAQVSDSDLERYLITGVIGVCK